MMTLDRAKNIGRWHPDALAWIEKAWIEDLEISLDGLRWNPQTLKQISTTAFGLSKTLGRIGEMMKLLAEIEVRLFQLREKIGIDRKAPSNLLPRVAAFIVEKNGLIAPGKWIPDILDRAACFDPIHTINRDSVSLQISDLAAFQLDHVILLGNAVNWPGEEDWRQVTLQKIDTIPQDLEFPPAAIHFSKAPACWIRSSPSVFDAVQEAAELIHSI